MTSNTYGTILCFDTEEQPDGVINLAVRVLEKPTISRQDVESIAAFICDIVKSQRQYNVVLDVRTIRPFTYLKHVQTFAKMFAGLDGQCILSAIVILNNSMKCLLPQIHQVIASVTKKNIMLRVTE